MPTTLTFPHWLIEQEPRTDEIGDFARQIADLDDFPASGGKFIYDGYFETAQPAQQSMYERAWSEFTAHPEPSVS